MTERLYYNDSTMLEFESSVVEVGMIDGRYFTILESTAFYPTSGGQLFDTGTLNGIKVVDVIEREDSAIIHISEDQAGEAGERLVGNVDPIRRLHQMQKHSAQHIFSAVAHRESNLTTMSVHLGEEYVAVELDTSELSQEQLNHYEKCCNDIIGESHPIEILFLERGEAEKLPLRKPIQRDGINRIIRIQDVDYQACGGTHCRNSADVRMLKIIGTEKLHGRLSIRFLAGDQAFEDYCSRFNVTADLTHQLTCHLKELPDRVRSISAENKQLRQEVGRIQKEMLPNMVAQLTAKQEESGAGKLVCASYSSLNPKLASKLSGMVADNIGGVCLLIVGDRMIIGVSKQSGQHAGNLAKTICADSMLRGGGSQFLAQIGGLKDGMTEQYYESLRKALSAQ